MSLFANASPQFIPLGIKDNSGRVILPESIPIPQHVPMFYIYAKQGPDRREYVTGTNITTIYGSETFDLKHKWFTHQTRYLNLAIGNGNNCMVQRIIPEDAGPKANAVVYADILKTNVPNYVRDSIGNLVVDPKTNNYKVDEKTPTIPGYKVKFIREYFDNDQKVGKARVKAGTMRETVTDAPDSNKEILYIRANNFRTRYKVGEKIDLSMLDYPAKDNLALKVSSSTADIITGKDLEWKAATVGKTKLTIVTTVPENPELYVSCSITLDIEVVPANAQLKTYPNMQVTGRAEALTPNNKTITLNLWEDTAGATITVSNTQVATVDAAKKSITGIENGNVFVTVTFPGDQNKEAAQSVFSLVSSVKAVKQDVTSTMYPIFERKSLYKGEHYNNNGFSISSLSNDEINSKIVSEHKALTYNFSLHKRKDAKSTGYFFETVQRETSINISLKPDVINPDTDEDMTFETKYKQAWYNETDPLLPYQLKEDEGFVFYRDNYETVTRLFIKTEKPYISNQIKTWNDGEEASTLSWFDFTSTGDGLDKENYLFNIFSLKSSKDIKYFSVVQSDLKSVFENNQTEVTMSGDTPVWNAGGSDGTMTKEKFEEAVMHKIADYANINSNVQDMAVNVDSIFYDSGFSYDNKKLLADYIRLRKDTKLVAGTYVDGEEVMSVSDQRSRAVALQTRYKLAPESTYFGTKTCRAIVVAGSGIVRDGSNRRVPLTYEILDMASKYMGASTGKWDDRYKFDTYPNNALKLLTDIEPAEIPGGVKPLLWNAGLVWAQPFSREEFHFPAIQTVYDDDTSVLNNFFTVSAAAYLNRLAFNTWKKFTGSSGMTDAEFLQAVNADLTAQTDSIFSSALTVICEAEITSKDEQYGYVWHTTAKIYSPVMKTVNIFTIEAFRSSDLETVNNNNQVAL